MRGGSRRVLAWWCAANVLAATAALAVHEPADHGVGVATGPGAHAGSADDDAGGAESHGRHQGPPDSVVASPRAVAHAGEHPAVVLVPRHIGGVPVDPTIPTVPTIPDPVGGVIPTTTTTTAPPDDNAFEVSGREGYWVADVADTSRPTARWLMPIVNSGESWSPDGTRVAYRSSLSAISIVDVRSGQSHLLVERADRSLGDPVWSPDGAHVAVHETKYGEPPTLSVVDLDGKEVARYPDWVDGQQGYAWSPDGTRIAWAGFNYQLGQAWLSVATLGEQPAKVATADGDHRFLGLHWSPLGTYLGWTYDEDLHLLRLSTGAQQSFALDGSPVYGHAWLPDEHEVVVWSNRLFLMGPDGAGLRVIDSAGHNAGVDPTTGRIAWTTGYSVGHERVVVSDSDGTNQTTLLRTAPDAGIDGVSWAPTGDRLLFIEYA